MRKLFLLTCMLILTACRTQAEPTAVPSPETTEVTNTPAPSATPRQQFTPTPTVPKNTPRPTQKPAPTETPQFIPDLSEVTLFETTHLMDPRYFQVAFEGWPAETPEGLIVRVDKEIYDCDILFPDVYPDRLYCWGLAPRRGTNVLLQVIVENIPRPLLEIPFVVPYPGGSGDEDG